MVKRIIVSEALLETGCQLGEGSLWVRGHSSIHRAVGADHLTQDQRRQKLYFVDIENCKIYTYDPSSGSHGFQSFDHRPTALALLEDDSGVRFSPYAL